MIHDGISIADIGCGSGKITLTPTELVCNKGKDTNLAEFKIDDKIIRF